MKLLHVFCTLAFTAIASAETIVVCPSGCQYISINEAIDAAQDGDVIELLGGTYFEGQPVNTSGKMLTIRGTVDKDGELLSILDGSDQHTVLECVDGEGPATLFKDLIVQNGRSPKGGGMIIENAGPTIEGCIFRNNSSLEGGGGMYIEGGLSTAVNNCAFRRNKAGTGGPTRGGAVFISEEFLKDSEVVTFDECVFDRNTAIYGGGIYTLSSVTIMNSTFTLNQSEQVGGGIYFARGVNTPEDSLASELIDCVFAENLSKGVGGGLYCQEFHRPNGNGLGLCGNAPENWSGYSYIGSYACQSLLPDCGDCSDDDSDGVPDFSDICPEGDDTIDTDQDGTPDFCDECPTDPLKTMPGRCGCNVIETDLTGDIDCDGDEDIDDYNALGNSIGTCTGDLNGDGVVDGQDLAVILAAWGFCAE